MDTHNKLIQLKIHTPHPLPPPFSLLDTAARQSPMEAVRRSIRKFEDKRYAMMKQRNIIGQVCHTPKSYDNVMQVGLRKVTFKWQRGNKIGAASFLLHSL